MSDQIDPQKSVLDFLPEHIDSRTLIYFEAIRHTLRMIQLMYQRLETLLSNQDLMGDDQQDGIHDLAMVDVWGLVDCFYRLRQLLSAARGIKKNQPWYQIFFRKLSSVEDFRHFLQHYDKEIPSLEESSKPIAGHLCWVNASSRERVAVSVIVPGRVKPGKIDMVNPMGKTQYENVDHITFFLADLRLDLSDLYRDLRQFVVGLEGYICERYGGPNDP